MSSGLRGALVPDVDAHSGSFLGRRWGGMPGPVWSMAAWYAAMASIMLVNLVALGVEGAALGLRAFAEGWWAAGAVVLVLLRDRTPAWLLHLLLDAGILIICLTSLTAATDIRALAQMVFIIVPAVYAATWFPRQQMALHLLLLVLLTGLAVIGGGVYVDSGRVWVVLMCVAISMAYFVNALVRHLKQQATIDPVTGLLNRAGLEAVADGYARRAPTELQRTVVVLDIDGFKAINDRLGHAGGDDVLREVGAVMREQLRPTDTIARTGGDEFVILLMRTDAGQARQVIDRLVRVLPAQCSYGIAEWRQGEAFAGSVGRADSDMYELKRSRQAGAGSS